jgi:hypothetical protein
MAQVSTVAAASAAAPRSVLIPADTKPGREAFSGRPQSVKRLVNPEILVGVIWI